MPNGWASAQRSSIPLAAYAAAIGFAFVNPWISCTLYVAVALMWLAPDKRIADSAGFSSEIGPLRLCPRQFAIRLRVARRLSNQK
jgi:hypothetical protein